MAIDHRAADSPVLSDVLAGVAVGLHPLGGSDVLVVADLQVLKVLCCLRGLVEPAQLGLDQDDAQVPVGRGAPSNPPSTAPADRSARRSAASVRFLAMGSVSRTY